jgi:hypothetical protein
MKVISRHKVPMKGRLVFLLSCGHAALVSGANRRAKSVKCGFCLEVPTDPRERQILKLKAKLRELQRDVKGKPKTSNVAEMPRPSLDSPQTATCTKCKKTDAVKAFGWQKRKSGQWHPQSWCRDCRITALRASRAA